jgi:hypothetical protein
MRILGQSADYADYIAQQIERSTNPHETTPIKFWGFGFRDTRVTRIVMFVKTLFKQQEIARFINLRTCGWHLKCFEEI